MGEILEMGEYRVGRLYTRGGDDVQKLVRITNDISGEFLCVLAPESGWCQVGDLGHNLLRRYAEAVIDGEVVRNRLEPPK